MTSKDVFFAQKKVLDILHPGRITWNLQITHLEKKIIFQTSMVMFHVNLQGCTLLQGGPLSVIKGVPFLMGNWGYKLYPFKWRYGPLLIAGFWSH